MIPDKLLHSVSAGLGDEWIQLGRELVLHDDKLEAIKDEHQQKDEPETQQEDKPAQGGDPAFPMLKVNLLKL